MITTKTFRSIALSMKDAAEGAHMNHPDFRANGKVFATLYPDGKRGMVKLTPAQQQDFIANSKAFEPASGAWGQQGCTTVRLAVVEEDQLGEAMTLAWQNVMAVKAKAKTKQQGRRRNSSTDK